MIIVIFTTIIIAATTIITFITAPTMHELNLSTFTTVFPFHRVTEEKALNEARSEPQCIDNGERQMSVREKDDQNMVINGEVSRGG